MSTNALIDEKSPYLQQHAHNPVNWLPWGEKAFLKARLENKPIFLSIGYSTCHWCHVMERESFESDEIADVLNRDFVSIKVDREERPDVDRIYMLFVQASTGSGGWPMSVWLTPDLKPFFGGTYFPPDGRYGRPGFRQVLEHIARAWRDDRGKIESSGENVISQLQNHVAAAQAAIEPDKQIFEAGFWVLRRSFDAKWGGFGGAPKFPRPAALHYLLRYYKGSGEEEALEMAVKTLDAMASGGMHDHLGGGFHRYSVDERWFVPHFEKMLYDQAQLAISYLEVFQITGEPRFETVVRDIVDYVLRDLTDPEGGFYSAEDADSIIDPANPSEKGEGAFYIWTQKEIDSLLGREAAGLFSHRYGVQPEGNVTEDPHGEFTGRNILYDAFTEEETAREYKTDPSRAHSVLAESREKLLAARNSRPRPHLDDKVLTSWNSLMISALAKSARVLHSNEYLAAAQRAADFLLRTMYSKETGVLLRRYRKGDAAIPGFLDDYAFFILALLDLYEANFDPRYLQIAVDLAQRGLSAFEDQENGGFFSTSATDPHLVLRIKDDYDGAEPSGNSAATEALLRLAQMTGEISFRERAEKSLRASAGKLRDQPINAPYLLASMGRLLAGTGQIVVRCAERSPRAEQILNETRQQFLPYDSCFLVSDDDLPVLAPVAPFIASLERRATITLYECKNFVCELPKNFD